VGIGSYAVGRAHRAGREGAVVAWSLMGWVFSEIQERCALGSRLGPIAWTGEVEARYVGLVGGRRGRSRRQGRAVSSSCVGGIGERRVRRCAVALAQTTRVGGGVVVRRRREQVRSGHGDGPRVREQGLKALSGRALGGDGASR